MWRFLPTCSRKKRWPARLPEAARAMFRLMLDLLAEIVPGEVCILFDDCSWKTKSCFIHAAAFEAWPAEFGSEVSQTPQRPFHLLISVRTSPTVRP
jgi:hypothetical protein